MVKCWSWVSAMMQECVLLLGHIRLLHAESQIKNPTALLPVYTKIRLKHIPNRQIDILNLTWVPFSKCVCPKLRAIYFGALWFVIHPCLRKMWTGCGLWTPPLLINSINIRKTGFLKFSHFKNITSFQMEVINSHSHFCQSLYGKVIHLA